MTLQWINHVQTPKASTPGERESIAIDVASLQFDVKHKGTRDSVGSK